MNLLYSDALQLKLRVACFRWYACAIVRYVDGCVLMVFCVGICETICVLDVCFYIVFVVCVCLVGVGIMHLKIIYQDIILFICYYIDKIIFFVWYGCKNIGFIC